MISTKKLLHKILDSAFIKAGDSIAVVWNGAGYLTSSSQQISVTIPFRQIIVASGVTVTNARLTTRQNGSYTHGSSGSANVEWTVTVASISASGVNLNLQRTTTTNAVNNEAIGINLSATFTFS